MALSARMFGRVPDESEADTPALEAKVSALEAKVSAGDMEPSTLLELVAAKKLVAANKAAATGAAAGAAATNQNKVNCWRLLAHASD